MSDKIDEDNPDSVSSNKICFLDVISTIISYFIDLIYLRSLLENFLMYKLHSQLKIALFNKDVKLIVSYPTTLGVRLYGKGKDLSAELTIVKPLEVFKEWVLYSDVGMGGSYATGAWKTDNLESVLKTMSIISREIKPNSFSKALSFYKRFMLKNTISGSRKNIAAHYDLGNEMFKLFLDKTMTYSSAIFEPTFSIEDTETLSNEKLTDKLEEAQYNKYNRILNQLEVKEGESILEIGCGWGNFAIHAAKTKKCKVLGITLSKEQYDIACSRVITNDLSNYVTFQLVDYRHVKGTFDHVVSIEMIEAVGYENFNTYFNVISQRLKKGGKTVIQAITYPEENYMKYVKDIDFIRAYIFPGGLLPSVDLITNKGRKNNLIVTDLFSIRKDYGKTLRIWDLLFKDNSKQLLKMGYDLYFQRLWHFYFVYCYVGFENDLIDALQITLVKE